MQKSVKTIPTLMLTVLLLVAGCDEASRPSGAASSNTSTDRYQRDWNIESPMSARLHLYDADIEGTTLPYPPAAGQEAELIVWVDYNYVYSPIEVAYRVTDSPPEYDPKNGGIINFNDTNSVWLIMEIVRLAHKDYDRREDVPLDPSEDPVDRSKIVQVYGSPLMLQAGTHYVDFKVTYPTDVRPKPETVPSWELTVE